MRVDDRIRRISHRVQRRLHVDVEVGGRLDERASSRHKGGFAVQVSGLDAEQPVDDRGAVDLRFVSSPGRSDLDSDITKTRARGPG
jgi:hypothetical protein